MIQRRHLFDLPAGLAIAVASTFQASAQTPQQQSNEGHVAWVVESLKRMLTIKPGMTRKELLTAFTTEGGLSTRLQRRYVSRDCPYFKVNVEFQAVGQPDGYESDRDLIVKISQPFLQFSILD